ncbi:MAG: SMC-Scp complex subunit ScpB [Treponema sp.]|nr:SMC-Scp complex subunit ScpB [Spirochaetia bacterium]MDD7013867.1 SMC-Scp complex subunit ScpB [Spirochaetales bacterium]MDY4903043.1 SMC-Scp complex subunit ScpB [Treponema sp.]
MNFDDEAALLETVLFLESEPQPVETLSKITQMSADVVLECIEHLKDKYSASDSGIELSQIIGGWQLTPKKECFDFVKERYGKKNEGRLSKSAVETLAIIAYSQPITRAEIFSLRHVSPDNMIRMLLDRKFIKEVGKKDIPGKPVMYGTTKEFLEFFHLQSLADLPKLEQKDAEKFELSR